MGSNGIAFIIFPYLAICVHVKLTLPVEFGYFLGKYTLSRWSKVTSCLHSGLKVCSRFARSSVFTFPLNLQLQPLSVNVAVPYNVTGINHARSKQAFSRVSVPLPKDWIYILSCLQCSSNLLNGFGINSFWPILII